MDSLSQTPDSECFICRKSLDEGVVVTVKKKGVLTLLGASVKRRQTDHSQISKNRDEIRVHSACSKNYSDPSRIDVALRSESPTPETSAKHLRSVSEKFIFKGHCFLCGEKVPEDYLTKQKKLPMNLRNPVRLVEKMEVRDIMLQAARARGDEWAQQIINRVPLDFDIIAADGQYHDACRKQLFQPLRSSIQWVCKRIQTGPQSKRSNGMCLCFPGGEQRRMSILI